jgi:phenylacetate-coenzyme A ligase PaaK-like adenylate-forming protein
MSIATSTLADLRARLGGLLGPLVPEHLQRLDWDDDRLAVHQAERLRALLDHARERSPWHAERLAGIDVADLDDLPRLPVMTKRDLMDRFDHVVTDRRLTRAAVEAHLEVSSTEPSLLLDEYVCLASGGSSGLRGVFVQSLAQYAEFSATVLRRPLARLLGAGPPPEGGLLIAMIAGPTPVHSTGFGAATAGGPARFVSVPATLPVAEAVQRLNDAQPPALQGYATKLGQLAREQRAGRLRIAPRSITSTSEQLTPGDRRAIEEAFGIPVVDQFAATEGMVGHSEPGGRTLTFASDTCIIEPVDADNRPVPPGTASAKVLVTNLHNFTQPMLRLEVTDRFVARNAALGEGFLRATADGRADDRLRYDDLEIHPITVGRVLVQTPAISEYQVRQTARGVEAVVAADGPLDEAALAAEIADGLEDAGLAEPEVAVRRVEAIARDPRTGKVRRVVPL